MYSEVADSRYPGLLREGKSGEFFLFFVFLISDN